MKTYKVQLDHKIEVWTRQSAWVEAESIEEAIAKADAAFDDGEGTFEYLSETECRLSPEENDNQSTEEWLVDEETIRTNAPI